LSESDVTFQELWDFSEAVNIGTDAMVVVVVEARVTDELKPNTAPMDTTTASAANPNHRIGPRFESRTLFSSPQINSGY